MTRLAALLAILIAACSSTAEPSGTSERDQGSDIATFSDADDVSTLDTAPELGTETDGDPVCETLGCPCEDDGECASGYCVGGPTEGRVCSEFCSGTCSLPGYECRLLVNSGGDAVQLCVPSALSYCAACTLSTDCPRLDDVCVAYEDGSFCAPDCTTSQLCPAGAECAPLAEAPEAGSFCQPADGVCAGCIDDDEDGYGRGPACEGPDCDEDNPEVYEDADELCNSFDDDCDGSVDEGFSLLTDEENCGGCGVVCDLDNASAACVGGLCEIAECDEDWGDCNAEPDDGCETNLTADESCGTCAELGGVPGSECGTCGSGAWACNDGGDVNCAGDLGDDALNACGGCAPIDVGIGSGCGTCDLGLWVCGDGDSVECGGDPGDSARNACGGCAVLDAAPDDPCGTCGSGLVTCVTDDIASCAGDLGERALNACGGCSELPGAPGDPCPACATLELECFDPDALACEPSECCAGETEDRECGVSGTQNRSCIGTAWSAWSVCDEGSVCEDGALGSQPCGACGTQERTCIGDTWSGWGACAEDECCPGETEEDDCGCGSRSRACSDGAWGDWSSCDGLICCPGSTQDQICGRCGSQTRDCDPSGTWSIWWTICMEPQCCAGDVDSEPCGGSGTRTRGCVGGVWDAWGECIDPT